MRDLLRIHIVLCLVSSRKYLSNDVVKMFPTDVVLFSVDSLKVGNQQKLLLNRTYHKCKNVINLFSPQKSRLIDLKVILLFRIRVMLNKKSKPYPRFGCFLFVAMTTKDVTFYFSDYLLANLQKCWPCSYGVLM